MALNNTDRFPFCKGFLDALDHARKRGDLDAEWLTDTYRIVIEKMISKLDVDRGDVYHSLYGPRRQDALTSGDLIVLIKRCDDWNISPTTLLEKIVESASGRQGAESQQIFCKDILIPFLQSLVEYLTSAAASVAQPGRPETVQA